MNGVMVEYPKENAVIISGNRYESTDYGMKLLKLNSLEPNAQWTIMEQSLKAGRSRHVAFLIPDEYTDCR